MASSHSYQRQTEVILLLLLLLLLLQQLPLLLLLIIILPSSHLGGWRSYGYGSSADIAAERPLKVPLWHNKDSLFDLEILNDKNKKHDGFIHRQMLKCQQFTGKHEFSHSSTVRANSNRGSEALPVSTKAATGV